MTDRRRGRSCDRVREGPGARSTAVHGENTRTDERAATRVPAVVTAVHDSARSTRRQTRVVEAVCTVPPIPFRFGGPYTHLLSTFCKSPQPRSWGKPRRDAKSVVPRLRPGDRRARRRWPAAAGLFWLREWVRCETETGVVIIFVVVRAVDPPVGGPADAGCSLPLGVRDGSAAKTWTRQLLRRDTGSRADS